MLNYGEFLNLFVWLDPNETKSQDYNKEGHDFLYPLSSAG